jgi:hypothetical protein
MTGMRCVPSKPRRVVTFHDGELCGDADAGAHVDAVGAAADYFQDFGGVGTEDACGGEERGFGLRCRQSTTCLPIFTIGYD